METQTNENITATKIDNIRAAYTQNLYRVVRHFGSLYGKLSYSRQMPKYELVALPNMHSVVDFDKPFCVFSNKNDQTLVFMSTGITRGTEEVLRYVEIVLIDECDDVIPSCILYNHKTNFVRLLSGDPASIKFLFLLPERIISKTRNKDLRFV